MLITVLIAFKQLLDNARIRPFGRIRDLFRTFPGIMRRICCIERHGNRLRDFVLGIKFRHDRVAMLVTHVLVLLIGV
jgi:hypothetical protein